MVEAGASSRDVLIGIRPEHFEDAALVGDKRQHGATVTRTVDVLESLGSDKYAYFTVEGSAAHSRELEELASDAGREGIGGGDQITARLDAASRAREGQPLEVWFDVRRAQVFDSETGRNLTLERSDADARAAAPGAGTVRGATAAH
jgi:multiple sugar transport system ATP-binding protein